MKRKVVNNIDSFYLFTFISTFRFSYDNEDFNSIMENMTAIFKVSGQFRTLNFVPGFSGVLKNLVSHFLSTVPWVSFLLDVWLMQNLPVQFIAICNTFE